MSFDRPVEQAKAKEQLDGLIKYKKDPDLLSRYSALGYEPMSVNISSENFFLPALSRTLLLAEFVCDNYQKQAENNTVFCETDKNSSGDGII